MTRPAFGGNTIATIACPDIPSTDGYSSSRCYAEGLTRVLVAKAEVIEFNPGFTPNNKYVEILEDR